MARTYQLTPEGVMRVRMRQMLDRLAKEGQADQGEWAPAVDIYETPRAVVIVAELAGVSHQDIKVMVEGDIVRLYGHREPTCCSQGARFHRMEIASGNFVRSFRISVPFDPEGVRAQAEDGFLVLTLPKARQDRRARQIKVEYESD